MKDAIGQAILDYAKTGKNKNIIVKSDICDDDVIPSEYLFRSYEEMPAIEQVALKRCVGKILDVGAAAGIHASYLKEQNLDVHCIDISEKSVEHLKSIGHSAECINFFDVEDQKYDTVLMLMNGLGIAGSLSKLELLLLKAKSLLAKNGKIIADSSDIKYLYQDEDGAMWLDLNAEYYGNFNFQMVYGEYKTDWFEWLYVDFEKLELAATKVGLAVNKIYDEDDHYLVEMAIIN